MLFKNLLNMSVKDWVDCFAALLTPTIAVLGLYIAYRQKRTEEAKLRHDLFERRYKQFDAVMKFISSVIVSGDPKDKDVAAFIPETLGIEFIFNEDIKNRVKNIRETAWKIQAVKTTPASEQLGERVIELKEDLKEQRALFERETLKYMQIQQPSLSARERLKKLAALFEKIKNAVN